MPGFSLNLSTHHETAEGLHNAVDEFIRCLSVFARANGVETPLEVRLNLNVDHYDGAVELMRAPDVAPPSTLGDVTPSTPEPVVEEVIEKTAADIADGLKKRGRGRPKKEDKAEKAPEPEATGVVTTPVDEWDRVEEKVEKPLEIWEDDDTVEEITKDDVVAKLNEASGVLKGGSEAVRAIMAQFGGKKLPLIPETKWADLHAALSAAIAKGL